MKKLFAILFCFISLQAFAQLPPGVDKDNIDPSQIPDPATLQQMGANPEQIKDAMEFKKEADQGADQPNIPAPIENKVVEQLEQGEQKLEQQLEQKVEAIEEKAENKAEAKVEQVIKMQSDEIPPANVFGQQFFRDYNIEFYSNASQVRAPENYVLGTGDEINVTVWGFSDYSENFKVGADGYITVREAGRVYLKDRKLADAEALIKARFSSFLDLANSKIDITLIYSRVITVNIVGEVFTPGSYKIPAINTAFNALVKSKGPNNIGSVRNIYIKRNGKTVKTLDVYQFLLNPDSKQDFFLQDNDYIFVPPMGEVVDISGEISKPFKYELKKNEDLETLIKYAGGLKVSAWNKNIQISRIDRTEQILVDVDLEQLRLDGKKFDLDDGDVIMVFKSPGLKTRVLEINGAVRIPGSYAYSPGTRVSKLIKQAQGLMPDAYMEQAHISRLKDDYSRRMLTFHLDSVIKFTGSKNDPVLDEFDIVTIFSKRTFLDEGDIEIEGSVRKPGTFPYVEGSRISDLILAAGGTTPDVYLENGHLSRLNDDYTRKMIAFSLDSVINHKNTLSDYVLEKDDIVTIYSKAIFAEEGDIVIEGAVRKPGSFRYVQGATLNDLILAAGGLTPEVYRDRAYIRRQRLDGGRDVIPLSLDTANGNFNQVVFRNDIIQIYSIRAFHEEYKVAVFGEVREPGEFPYDEGMTLKDILYYARGIKRNAANDRIEISRSVEMVNGDVFNLSDRVIIKTIQMGTDLMLDKESESFRLNPNDQVYVRTNPNFLELRSADITGEVLYPGKYAILGKDERLSDLIGRAGGLNDFAFEDGSRFFRNYNDIGMMFLDLDKVVKRPKSRYNYRLEDGDKISIPKSDRLVHIEGAINYPGIIELKRLNAPYRAGKRANYYVRKYGGGFQKNAKKRGTFVLRPDGIKRNTKNFVFFKLYPKVKEGSDVTVVLSEKKEKKEKEPRAAREKTFDWNTFIQSTSAAVVSIMTIYLLVQNSKN